MNGLVNRISLRRQEKKRQDQESRMQLDQIVGKKLDRLCDRFDKFFSEGDSPTPLIGYGLVSEDGVRVRRSSGQHEETAHFHIFHKGSITGEFYTFFLDRTLRYSQDGQTLQSTEICLSSSEGETTVGEIKVVLTPSADGGQPKVTSLEQMVIKPTRLGNKPERHNYVFDSIRLGTDLHRLELSFAAVEEIAAKDKQTKTK